MKRVVGYLVGIVVVVAVVLVPAVIYGINLSSEDTSEPTTITSYVADFDVDAHGDMVATEKLTVDFPVSGRHGIFRFFDREDPNDPNVRLQPHDIEVTADGRPVPVTLLSPGHGRYVNARIGDPDITLSTGEHVYVIRYQIDGVLSEGSGGTPTQFYWNLVPGGWKQPIEKTDLTVHLPVAAQDAGATSGAINVGDVA